jgi:PREDICTED: hypothetical protein LOC100490358
LPPWAEADVFGLDGVLGVEGFDGVVGLEGFDGVLGVAGLEGLAGCEGVPGLEGVEGFDWLLLLLPFWLFWLPLVFGVGFTLGRSAPPPAAARGEAEDGSKGGQFQFFHNAVSLK